MEQMSGQRIGGRFVDRDPNHGNRSVSGGVQSVFHGRDRFVLAITIATAEKELIFQAAFSDASDEIPVIDRGQVTGLPLGIRIIEVGKMTRILLRVGGKPVEWPPYALSIVRPENFVNYTEWARIRMPKCGITGCPGK
jgi:hypothetical protein